MLQTRRTQEQRSEETKSRLIDATITCLMERGFSGATIGDICRMAEVSSGAIQHHFGSKAGLMGAVADALFKPVSDDTPVLGPKKATLEERISRFVRNSWSTYGDDQYMAVMEVLLFARHDTELMSIVGPWREQRNVYLRKYLSEEFSDVNLSPDELYRIAMRVHDLLRGHAVLRLYDRDTTMTEAVLGSAEDILRTAFAPSAHPPITEIMTEPVDGKRAKMSAKKEEPK